MLEGLDAVDFTSLEDAYGPAAAVPDRLRALTGPWQEAEEALWDLSAGIFHQGSYYNATAPATRFLVELVAEELPARAAILTLLAEMSGGHAEVSLAWNPYLFHANPGRPDYPEAVATIEEIGRGSYESTLQSADPEVRARGAWLLAGLGRSAPAMAAALALEKDELVRCTFRLALHRLGHPLPAPLGELERDLDEANRKDGDPASLERLALHEPVDSQRLPMGDVASLGLLALGAHSDRPTVIAALWRILEARLQRGERIVEPASPPMRRVCDEEEPVPPRTPDGDDHGLRAVTGMLARLVMPQKESYLRRADLDGEMRRLLQLTVDWSIPLPLRQAPWITPATMARFLRGGGPLDEEVAILGEIRPLYEHFHGLAPHNDPRRQEKLRAIAGALDDRRLFDVIVDALWDAYPFPDGQSMAWMASAELAPLAQERLLAHPQWFAEYRDSLTRREDWWRERISFALLSESVAAVPTEPRHDALAAVAMSLEPQRRSAWLLAFPEPRRSTAVASLGSVWLCHELGEHCDPEALATAIVEAFVAPDCPWLATEAEQLLRRAGEPRLRALQVSGTRARLVERALAELTRQGFFVLSLLKGDGIDAELRRETGGVVATRTLPAVPLPRDLEWIGDAVAGESRPVITIEGDLDHAVRYQIVLALGGLIRGEIRES